MCVLWFSWLRRSGSLVGFSRLFCCFVSVSALFVTFFRDALTRNPLGTLGAKSHHPSRAPLICCASSFSKFWACSKAHSYRRVFFPEFPKFENIGRYVSRYGGVLSLFVKFSRRKKIRSVNFHVFGKKKSGTCGRLKSCAKKTWKLWEKSSSIRMTLTLGVCPTQNAPSPNLPAAPVCLVCLIPLLAEM